MFYLLGLPDDLIQKGKDIKSISEIEENGDDFKVTVTTGPKVLVNSFTIGKEAELDTITGEKHKVGRDARAELDCMLPVSVFFFFLSFFFEPWYFLFVTLKKFHGTKRIL